MGSLSGIDPAIHRILSEHFITDYVLNKINGELVEYADWR